MVSSRLPGPSSPRANLHACVCSRTLGLLILLPATREPRKLKHARFKVLVDRHATFWFIPQNCPTTQWTCLSLGALHIGGNSEDPYLILSSRLKTFRETTLGMSPNVRDLSHRLINDCV